MSGGGHLFTPEHRLATLKNMTIDQIHFDREQLVAHLTRLRGLIKDAEWAVLNQDANFCPWCGGGGPGSGYTPKHSESCPAFTVTGEVK